MGMHQQTELVRGDCQNAGCSSIAKEADGCCDDSKQKSIGIADYIWERRKYVLLIEFFLVVTSGVTIRLENHPGPTRTKRSIDATELRDRRSPIIVNGPLSWLTHPFLREGSHEPESQASAQNAAITDEE